MGLPLVLIDGFSGFSIYQPSSYGGTRMETPGDMVRPKPSKILTSKARNTLVEHVKKIGGMIIIYHILYHPLWIQTPPEGRCIIPQIIPQTSPNAKNILKDPDQSILNNDWNTTYSTKNVGANGNFSRNSNDKPVNWVVSLFS